MRAEQARLAKRRWRWRNHLPGRGRVEVEVGEERATEGERRGEEGWGWG